jgi:hypothetical protein
VEGRGSDRHSAVHLFKRNPAKFSFGHEPLIVDLTLANEEYALSPLLPGANMPVISLDVSPFQ